MRKVPPLAFGAAALVALGMLGASGLGASGHAEAMTAGAAEGEPARAEPAPAGEEVLAVEPLPPPDRTGGQPLAALLQARQSVRSFAPDSLQPKEIGQLLWAAGGLTVTEGRLTHRTIPSAGALFPLEFYLLTARGVAHYNIQAHALEWLQDKDRRDDLSKAALGQGWMRVAPAVIVIAAEPARTTVKYGERGERYAIMEAGFAGQNILLQAIALGLGAVPVGAFEDGEVSEVLGLPEGRLPMLIVPVGRPR